MSFFWRWISSGRRTSSGRKSFFGVLPWDGLLVRRRAQPFRRRLRFEPLENRLALDASISGNVFQDLSANGVKDAGDTGISGVNVFIDQNTNGTFDGSDIITTTDSNGDYTFAGLAAGTYTVIEQIPTGWDATPSGTPVFSRTVTVSANQDLTGQNFGLFPAAPSSVTLAAASDTGSSTSDGVTSLNNSAPANSLQFVVSGVIAGATVAVFDGSTQIGQATAVGNSVTVTTDGSTSLSEGSHQISATQSFHNATSVNSNPALSITIDSTPPQFTTPPPALPTSAQVGTDVEYNVNTNEEGNAGLTYSLVSGAPGMTINSSTGQISWPTAVLGVYNIDVKAVDLAGNVAIDPSTGQPDLKFTLTVVTGGTISGTAFEDFDGNGVKGAGETGLSGVTVYLDNNHNGVLDAGDASTTTAADGTYSFTALSDGTYTVREVVPAGWLQTSVAFYSATVSSSQDSADNNFGQFPAAPSNVALAAVSDTGASNSDGVTSLNNSSAGKTLQFLVSGVITGATVTLYDGSTQIGQAVASGNSVTVTTDGVTSLGDGLHHIKATQAFQNATSVDSSLFDITVDTSAPQFTTPPPALPTTIFAGTSLSYDVNTNEEGNPGLTYSLVSGAPGMTIDPSTGQISWPTAVVGVYNIDVKAVDLAGNVAIDPGTEQADLKFTLTVSAGATISGTAFEDFNADGNKQAGDSGLSGITIYLDNNNNGVLDSGDVSTTTAADGTYSFTGLPNGSYTVREVVPTGWLQTSAASSSVTISSLQDSTDNNFGQFPDAPTSVTLAAASDTGSSNSDKLTKLNNSSAGSTLQFIVSGVISGSTVTLFDGSTQIGQAVASGNTVTITTDGVTTLSDGLRHINATQSFQNATSVDSPNLDITVDATPPQFTTPPPPLPSSVQAGTDIEYDVNSDEELTTGVTYSLVSGAPGLVIDPSTGQLSWQTDATQTGTYDIDVQAIDAAGNLAVDPSTGLADLKFSITIFNVAPTIDPIADQTITQNSQLQVQVNASSPGGSFDLLTYSLDDAPTGASIDPSGLFTWTPDTSVTPGDYNITVRVSNASDQSSTQTFKVTVEALNHAPTIAPISDQTADPGSALTVNVVGNDEDSGQILTYSLDAGAPTGATIDASTGIFTFTPTNDQGGQTFPVTVRVTDNGDPNLSTTATFNVAVSSTSSTNTAPVVTPIANKTVNPGSTLSFNVTATDSDTPAQTLTYSLDAGFPAGASINASTGAFTFTPTSAQAGQTFPITVRVTDNGDPNMSGTATFNVAVNAPPVFTPISQKTVNIGSQLTFTAQVTHTNPVTFSLGTGAPAGAAINATTGVFTWTPTSANGAGTFSITLKATDTTTSLVGTTTVQVLVVQPNRAPVITTIGNQTVSSGGTLTIQVHATDPDAGQKLTYSLLAGAPAGASINATTGLITFNATTTNVSLTQSLTVKVTDNGSPQLSATQTFSITTNVNSTARGFVGWGVDPLVMTSPGKAVVVNGTDGSDIIQLLPSNLGDSVIVIINNVNRGTWSLAGVSRMVVNGFGGDDSIMVSKFKVGSIIDGGAGNDIIVAGNGNDVILGGAGNDNLQAHGGAKIMIGGAGTDTMQGGNGRNILIGGTTNFDANNAALGAILDEWSSSDSDAVAVARIQGTQSGGKNGANVLTAATVHNDSTFDQLNAGGDAALDWFFANLANTASSDQVVGNSRNRFLTQI